MSLMEGIDENTETSEESQEAPPESSEGANEDNAPNWFWDENTPGSGERPAWLSEKFKTVADAAKNYTELEKRLGSAPKEYDFSKAEEWLDPDYEPIQKMAEYAKSRHVPQDVIDNMLESVGKYLNEFTPSLEEERSKLGDNAKDRLTVLNNWMKSNFSEDAFNAITANLRTADAVIALEEVRRKMMSDNTLIENGNSETNTTVTLAEIQNEIRNNYDKYKTDSKYRGEVQKRMELAAKNSDYADKSY